jgi:catechol 2,3-dioxygenase-like lactoylglutathione lyase family enzyme
MQLDHATIVTKDIEAARRFFRAVVGLNEGPRPPFRIRGYWLYANVLPIIHLVDATVPAPEGKCAPRIDHIALRIDSATEWLSMIERLRSNGIYYETVEVPLTGELQLFVTLAPGIVIEFVTALPCATH